MLVHETVIWYTVRQDFISNFIIYKEGSIMKITDEFIDYIRELSRLELNQDEKEQAKKDLANILGYMTDKLNELDTNGMPEVTHPFSQTNEFRIDQIENYDRREELLKNAPDSKEDYFKVFKTIESVEESK